MFKNLLASCTVRLGK